MEPYEARSDSGYAESLDEAYEFSSATSSAECSAKALSDFGAPELLGELQPAPGQHLEGEVVEFAAGAHSVLPGAVAGRDLHTPYKVFREGLLPNEDVSVMVGPVVGKVTHCSAVILLEVNAAAEVALNFARVVEHEGSRGATQTDDAWSLRSLSFAPEGSLSLCQQMEPRRPKAFVVWGLEPATRYLALVSKVCKDDMDRRIARFRTLPTTASSMRFLAISGHCAPNRPLGTANPWQNLLAIARSAPEMTVVLHVGSTVDAAPAAANAGRVLRAYHDAWGQHDGLRRSLATVGAHLPIFAPPVELESMLNLKGEREEVVEEARVLLRASFSVYRDYQQALWRGSPETKTTDDQKDVFWQQFAEDSGDGSLEEWHFHRYGQVGVFMMDIKGHQLRPDGRLMQEGPEPRPLVSSQQWRALEASMADDSMRVMLLVSDVPFLLEPIDATASAASAASAANAAPSPVTSTRSSRNASIPARRSDPLDWRSSPAELHRLLKLLFDWKHAAFPAREAVLISSGPGFGTTGDICDHRLGLSVPAVLTGPVLGRVTAAERWNLRGSLAGGRFSYVYGAPAPDQWNFCALDLALADKPLVHLQLFGLPIPPGTWEDNPHFS